MHSLKFARVDIRGKLTCGEGVFIDINAVFEGNVSLGDNARHPNR